MDNALGTHYLLELRDCPKDLLNNLAHVKNALLLAAQTAKATVVDSSFNTFNPHGISGFVVIAESHLSIHTWPEYAYAAIDVFTCGTVCLPQRACDYLVSAFKAEGFFLYKLTRGLLDKNFPTSQTIIPFQCEVISNEFAPKRLAH